MTDPANRKRRQAEQRGQTAETVAAMLLRAKLYRIIGQRVKTPRGEIDIIARRGRLFVFAEVKSRPSHDAAMMSVTPRQAKRISDAAHIWLARNGLDTGFEYRFDIITVSSYLWPRHVRNAFAAEPW